MTHFKITWGKTCDSSQRLENRHGLRVDINSVASCSFNEQFGRVLMYNEFIQCTPFNLIIFDERTQPMYTIDIDIFCSNVNIHFSSSELMEKIRCIKRLHKSGCSCNYNDTCARDEFTPRFFSRQDIINNNNINTSLATGIELLFYGTIGWIKIPHDQVHASVVATLPWFWPWYNSNDISPLLYPLDAIHDKDFDLSVQINISRRRQYNNQYKFQVQMK